MYHRNTIISKRLKTHRVTRVVLLCIVCSTTISCNYIRNHSDSVVAKVGDHTLYKSDIASLIPAGTPKEDSLIMLEQYINRWATKNLMLIKAEEALSKEEKEVKNELEEYRSSLLLYKFENKYVKENLDTLVSNAECGLFYKEHPESFTLSSPIVKAGFIKISNSSPNLEKIRSLFIKSNNILDSAELDMICKHSAERYSNFDGKWVDLNVVSGELLSDNKVCERQASQLSYIDEKDNLYRYFAVFRQYKGAGEVAPYEFCESKIRGIILAKRKRELLDSLEENTIKEAKERDILKTYIKPTL